MLSVSCYHLTLHILLQAERDLKRKVSALSKENNKLKEKLEILDAELSETKNNVMDNVRLVREAGAPCSVLTFCKLAYRYSFLRHLQRYMIICDRQWSLDIVSLW